MLISGERTTTGGIVEITRNRMIHLGYAKYWRSDQIVGLLPIEDDRGPGRRTEVYVSNNPEPIVASRSEGSILRAMASMPDEAVAAEVGSIAEDLVEALGAVSPVLKRMLKSEEEFDVEYWLRRLRSVFETGDDGRGSQEDLFS